MIKNINAPIKTDSFNSFNPKFNSSPSIQNNIYRNNKTHHHKTNTFVV